MAKRGFAWFPFLILIFVLLGAFFLAPIIFPKLIFWKPAEAQSTPAAPTSAMTVNSINFCQTPNVNGDCDTGSASFSSGVGRVYATVAYSDGKVDTLFNIKWYKDGNLLVEDGAVVQGVTGLFTVSLSKSISLGNYELKIANDDGTPISSATFSISET